MRVQEFAVDFLTVTWAKMKLKEKKTHKVGCSLESSGRESLNSELKPMLKKGNLNSTR